MTSTLCGHSWAHVRRRCHKLPPELRAKVLAFHPEADAMPPTISLTSRELFDRFIYEKLPALRASPLNVAPRGSTENVALLIEPRYRACYAIILFVTLIVVVVLACRSQRRYMRHCQSETADCRPCALSRLLLPAAATTDTD